MTPEQQRIAIAEACGWRKQPDVTKTGYYGSITLHGLWITPDGAPSEDGLPDYLNDLNAMNAAEEALLTEANEQRYFEALHDVAGNLRFYRATAAQRAEALLHTINKWEISHEQRNIQTSLRTSPEGQDAQPEAFRARHHRSTRE